MNDIARVLEQTGQDHLLKFYEELSNEEKSQLRSDLADIDWRYLQKVYKEEVLPRIDDGKLKQALKIDDTLLKELPSECIEGTTRCDQDTLNKYRTIGLTSIGQGKVAALLLAGGQGTRLGVNYPKGMYDVGLPSHKTLFQLQAERILKLSEPLEMATGQKTQVIWYIMTSDATMEKTKDFFESHNYFGLNKNDVVFFEQGTIPSFGFDGKVFLSSKNKVARSPNGNGGLYESLHKKGIIDHMEANGVEYVHVYCVDNILVRVCDPIFMGFCISRQVDAGAKVVEKVLANESVGTICKVGEQFRVIEYSEISDNVAQRRDGTTGKLSFNAGNICEHFFTVKFLQSITGDKVLRYHLAVKKIPYVSLETGEIVKPNEPNGVKLEKFIFDVFEFTDKFAAWEVKREDEFSPLKNADGTEKDNPTTARKALLRSYELGLLTC